MKIHFSNVNFSSNSGPNSFGFRLANSFKNLGHEIVEDNKKEYDVFLCFIEPSSNPRHGSKFIHRLDGIWFKPEQFKTHNKNIKWAYDNCDHVVWQSEFDKKMTCHHWGDRNGSVIHNGISLENVDSETLLTNIKDIKSKITGRLFVSSASWHRQKRLKENIEFFEKNKKDGDIMIVMGPNPDVIIDKPHLQKSIIFTGKLSHNQCLEIFREADWMIHLAWLDHCPNVVVEALSQGCPVICTDSGGTKEIVNDNGIVIPETNPYSFELTDYDNPYFINIPEVNLDKIDVKNQHLDIENIAKKYLEIMK
jgi:glycosyltransferase involved in cell wall biosynthesis